MNLEQRAKQGHHKKSVQLYPRDDVWPSLFLQRDILVDISTGWRPLTSQSRGAKQPLPEPNTPTTSTETLTVHSDSDSDESSTSSSSNSSSEDHSDETGTTVLILNEKTHVIHAARATNPDSSKRSCFKIKETNYEVVCGSSVLNAPVKVVPEIPVGAKVCQRKACVTAIDKFIH